MSPDPRDRRKRKKPQPKRPAVRTGPSPDDPHDVVYFKRHRADDASQSEPGRDALNSYPAKVRATMRAALIAVASAPPKRFVGGGYWEAMKGDMTGWFELRVDGPGRHHSGCSACSTTRRKASTSHSWSSSTDGTSPSEPRCRTLTTPLSVAWVTSTAAGTHGRWPEIRPGSWTSACATCRDGEQASSRPRSGLQGAAP